MDLFVGMGSRGCRLDAIQDLDFVALNFCTGSEPQLWMVDSGCPLLG